MCFYVEKYDMSYTLFGGMMVTRKAPTWYHRIVKNSYGYIVNYVPKRGLVLEHRFVMEKELGRTLESVEEVHHINGVKDDNRPLNLVVVHCKDHNKLYHKTIKKSP